MKATPLKTIDASVFAEATATDGSNGNDTITGSAHYDILFGGAGNDRLITKGRGGDDREQ